MRLRSTSARALGAALLIGAAVLTGCSNDGDADGTDGAAAAADNGLAELSADEILDEVGNALEKATSVHMVGQIENQGTALEVDMSLSAEAPGSASGTIKINGTEITLISVDGQVYFSADTDFWASQGVPEAALSQVEGKFVEVPTTDDSFQNFTDFSGLVDELSTPDGDVQKGDESTVDGIPVIELIDTKDEGVLSVSLQGDALPLMVTSSEGAELKLTDWNEPVDVEAPADDEIVDLSTLKP